MTLEEVKEILIASHKNLGERKAKVGHRIYLEHVQQDAVHNACLAILKNNDSKKASEYAALFTQATKDLVEIYTDKEAAADKRDIEKNVQWNAMWEELQRYFSEVHGIDIGERDVFY